VIALLSATGVFLVSMNGCGGAIQHNSILAGKFQHIVIVVQENRTPENLFHDPVLIQAGADIASRVRFLARPAPATRWSTVAALLFHWSGLQVK